MIKSAIVKLIFIIPFFLSCSPSIKNLDSEGKNIICFGNSITSGVGARRGSDYPSLLQELVEKNVINAGVSGDTTKSALLRLKRDVLERDPYLVIIELGGNDFLKRMPKKETFKNLKETILKIQDKGAIVALCDVSGLFSMTAYRKHFAKLAKETGSIFIPALLKGILENPSLKYDYVHPNTDGYKLIAQKIYQALKPYL